MDKTVENLSDKELVQKFKEWKEVEKFGKSIETEVKDRFEEKGSLEGIRKVLSRTTSKWSDTDKLPTNFYKEVPLTVTEARKQFGNVDKYLTTVENFTYKINE